MFVARTNRMHQLYSVLVIQAAVRGFFGMSNICAALPEYISIHHLSSLVHYFPNSRTPEIRKPEFSYMMSYFLSIVRKEWKRVSLEASYSRSAILLQSVVRARLARRSFIATLSAIHTVQSAWRNAIYRHAVAARMQSLKSLQDRLDFKENRASKKISSFFRNIRMKNVRAMATLSLQNWYRAYRPLLRIRVMVRGFLRLQAFYRAYKIRSKNSQKVNALLKKILLAESKAISNPTLSMGKQTDGKTSY
jgi:IQ calmodulin-binding motif